ncbi:MAG TPA: hypothetical protein VEB86_07555 [Chryseosolibacter sp.]|nr:hypothetical protein [Chryseosolibacter sp.]
MSKPVPFDFVLEKLFRLQPTVKPMFGCHAVYVNDKIVLVLRKKDDEGFDNGVWLATSGEHHDSLRSQFPSLRSIRVFGGGETEWQNIPFDSVDFEESVTTACELILKNDPRIGRIPRKKKTGAK